MVVSAIVLYLDYSVALYPPMIWIHKILMHLPSYLLCLHVIDFFYGIMPFSLLLRIVARSIRKFKCYLVAFTCFSCSKICLHLCYRKLANFVTALTIWYCGSLQFLFEFFPKRLSFFLIITFRFPNYILMINIIIIIQDHFSLFLIWSFITNWNQTRILDLIFMHGINNKCPWG